MHASIIQIIKAKDVDLWNRDPDTLDPEIQYSHYPPSFQVLVDGQKAKGATFLAIHFKISDQNSDLSMNLPLKFEGIPLQV